MNMSCSVCFLGFVRGRKVEGDRKGWGEAPSQAPAELRWEPRVLTTWGALGRWVGDPARQLEGSLPTPQPFFGSRRGRKCHSRPCSEDEAQKGKATHQGHTANKGGPIP